MAKKGVRRDPLEGIPYGVNALIRNEGTTVEEILLSDIDIEDETFRLRPGRLEDLLTESLRASGQLVPIVVRYRERDGRWQVVAGFRRLRALQDLDRRTVLARLHDAMSDAEAIRLSVMDNFFGSDATGDHLDAYFDRLQRDGLLTQESIDFLDWAREKVARVAPPRDTSEVEDLLEEDNSLSSAIGGDTDQIPFPELITRTFSNLSDAAQGLEKIFLNWSDVSPSDRKILAAECKYIHDIYPFLTR